MIEAVRLRTEYMKKPIGLDINRPRLMWNVAGAKKQTAYEVSYTVNGGTEKALAPVETDAMFADFPETLKSRDMVHWRVRLTDENGGTGAWSQEQSFEMGLLDRSDWTASWITGDYDHSKKGDVRYPVDCFRKVFFCGKKLAKARLYAAACGLYEARLNGERVGDAVLTPGSTGFHKRVNYQVYDVTDLLVAGENNTLNLELADGFYASKTGVFDKVKVFGYEPKLIAQLELSYEDGTRETVRTDSGFSWCNDGPVTFADMKDGEIVDYTREESFNGMARVTSYHGILSASNSVPAREKEVFSVTRIIACPDGGTVLDFGQNIAGSLQVDAVIPKGQKVSFICGEKLDENGSFTVKNIKYRGDYQDGHFQRIDITGDGKHHTYKTRFSIMGFQYVLVINWPGKLTPDAFRAIAVYSDMDVTGRFTCSDEKVTKIVENTLWSMKGNFMDVPTDCPTRERAGWTGDAQLFFDTGNIFMDQAAFFRKWMTDVVDGQEKSGLVYNINPGAPKKNALLNWVAMESSCGWGDALIMIPYRYWKRYGDDRLMSALWAPMTACFNFYKKRMGRFAPMSGLKKAEPHWRYVCGMGRGFGEWTEPADCAPPQTDLLKPCCEENTAYLAYDARIMAEMAEHLGKGSEAAEYATLAEKISTAYEFYFLEKALAEPKRECKAARPCGLGVVSDEAASKLRAKLVRMNGERDCKVGTGFLSTPFLLSELTKAGAADDAFKVLTNPEIGWMKEINEGATTIWENWTDDASMNHYSKGACCGWLFEDVCGLRVDGAANHFSITPHLVSALDFASLSYDSVYGTVSAGWKRTEAGVAFEFDVPSNCTASVELPDGRSFALETGKTVIEK